MVVPGGFEPPSPGPKPEMMDRYTTGLRPSGAALILNGAPAQRREKSITVRLRRMRRGMLSVGLALLFVIGAYAPLFHQLQSPTNVIVEPKSEETLPFQMPSSTVFSPSQQYWSEQEIAEPMVLTRDLRTLHAWQIAHGLLPEQAPGNLQDVSISTGIVEIA